ncbi:MAG: hypothetical protein IIA64_06165 [Planctomycetes bacterium]|nr:hypothetical protein [Planctomycetota bacterium]
MRRRNRRMLFVALGALAVGAGAGGEPPLSHAQAGMPSFARLVRLYDFEEAEQAPYVMPINFYRHEAPQQGFPRFGRTHLTRDAAHGGNWSFGFELDGGSLSARIPTAVIPVLPGSDYRVTAWIRTDGLTHSRARLSAWLNDDAGNPVAESRLDSRLFRTGGAWQLASILVQGNFDDAVDLVVDLQLLQPQQYIGPNRPPEEPLLEDMSGRAWFDDVTITNLPRIELSTSSLGNVVPVSDNAQLSVLIRDLTGEDLTGRLRLLDLDGAIVGEETFPIDRGTTRRVIDLSTFGPGWYSAVLDVRAGTRTIARRQLDLVVMPNDPVGSRPHENTFGVVLPPTPAQDLKTAVAVLRQLGVSRAVISLNGLDSEAMPRGPKAPNAPAVRRAAKELLADSIELTFLLDDVQRRTTPERQEQPDLDNVLANFSMDVRQWQVGAAEAFQDITQEQLLLLLTDADAALSEFVAGPVINIPWPIERAPFVVPSPHGFNVALPYHVQPDALSEYASLWRDAGSMRSVTLQQSPAGSYHPRERVTDLVLRTLFAWRAGFERLTIDAPWSRRGEHRPQIMPDPSFGPWHMLANQLGRRRFLAEMPLGDGLRGWMLTGAGPRDAVIVAWNEQAPKDKAVIRMLLADGPIDVLDVFGKRETIYPVDGVHTVALDRVPVFIEHVDLNLAKFRAGFAILPGFVPARRQAHEQELIITNPWDMPISAEIRLRPPDGWRITPRSHRVTLQPGDQRRLPIILTFDPGVIAERTHVDAEIVVEADHEYHLNVRTELEVGLKEVRLSTQWQAVRNIQTGTYDLIVMLYLTNTGDRALTFDGYLSAPEMSRQRRPIATLSPGRTAVKIFRITDGARLLAGKQVRVGIVERGGNARLNRILDIPPFADPTKGEPLITSGSR